MQDCEDIIVVGSGASGAAAALQCSGFRLKTLLVDVGISSEDSTNSSKHYYDRKKSENLEDLLLGRDLEGLEAALDGSELPFKLSMPLLKYITRREFDLPPRVSDAQLISTHAFGGLANGWSCGLYEYNERDLLGFPFAASDLAPYYSKLCREAGIVGRLDDLQPFFGNNISQDFSTISRKCGYLEEKYHARKEKLQENNGFYLGRARVALAGAKPGEQNGYELMANGEALYVPAQTVRRLLLRKMIRARLGLRVLSIRKKKDHMVLIALDIRSQKKVSLKARHILLGAGCINSAEIVLRSLNARRVERPLLDNPTFRIPLILPGFFGAPFDPHTFNLVQLNCVWDKEIRMQGTIIELNGLRRTDVVRSFPLAIPEAIRFSRHISSALLAMQLYLPADSAGSAKVSLGDDDRIFFRGPATEVSKDLIRGFPQILRSLGALTHNALIKPLKYGGAIHYSGSFPMKLAPGPFESDKWGELHDLPGLSIIDSANFSALPAKNNSLTIMANAMRISDHVCRRLMSK